MDLLVEDWHAFYSILSEQIRSYESDLITNIACGMSLHDHNELVKPLRQLVLQFSDVEERPRSSNTHLTRNSIPRNSGGSNKRPDAVSEVRSRPAPAALQEVVDRPSVGRGQRLREPATGNEPSDWSIPIILTSHWSGTEQPLRFSEPVAREQQPLRFSEAVSREEQPSRFIEAQEPVRLSEPEPSQPILPARLTPIR